MECPNCGELVPDGVAVCPVCKQELHELQPLSHPLLVITDAPDSAPQPIASAPRQTPRGPRILAVVGVLAVVAVSVGLLVAVSRHGGQPSRALVSTASPTATPASAVLSPTQTLTPTSIPTQTPTSFPIFVPTPVPEPTATPSPLPTPTATPAPVLIYAINAGGDAVANSPYLQDQFFDGGSTYSTEQAIDTSGVTDPAPQAVYQTERWGVFTYTFYQLTAGANYRVRLDFDEIYFTSNHGKGQRVFNVFINGTQVLTNFDIYAAAGGPDKAIAEIFTTQADGHGRIVIQFEQGPANYPKVSGIEIFALP